MAPCKDARHCSGPSHPICLASLAIDLGLKRTGLAVTDPLRIIATALDTVPTAELMTYLKAYVARKQVDGFVVGLPMHLDGKPDRCHPPRAGVRRPR